MIQQEVYCLHANIVRKPSYSTEKYDIGLRNIITMSKERCQIGTTF